MRIAIVDDEEEVREAARRYLAKMLARYWSKETAVVQLDLFDSAEALMECFDRQSYDLVLLDIMLPDMDGLEVCRRVREISDVPIIMLTAKDDVEDKVNGLDIGADDYITKPFAIQELLARVRAAIRVHKANEAGNRDERVLAVKDLVLYPGRYEVRVKGELVELTKKEYSLLEYMLRNKPNVLTRDQILQEVWGYDYVGDTNVVDVYIRYLRAKIDERFDDKYIYTVRGVGYAVKG